MDLPDDLGSVTFRAVTPNDYELGRSQENLEPEHDQAEHAKSDRNQDCEAEQTHDYTTDRVLKALASWEPLISRVDHDGVKAANYHASRLEVCRDRLISGLSMEDPYRLRPTGSRALSYFKSRPTIFFASAPSTNEEPRQG